MFFDIIIVILIISAAISAFRVVIGPTVWDRLLGFSLVGSKFIMIIVIFSYSAGNTVYLDIALIFAVLGFIGTTSISKFLQKNNSN